MKIWCIKEEFEHAVLFCNYNALVNEACDRMDSVIETYFDDMIIDENEIIGDGELDIDKVVDRVMEEIDNYNWTNISYQEIDEGDFFNGRLCPDEDCGGDVITSIKAVYDYTKKIVKWRVKELNKKGVYSFGKVKKYHNR